MIGGVVVILSEKKALQHAVALLEKMSCAEKYDLSRPQVKEKFDSYEFSFRRKIPSRPQYGVVKVNKRTGEAQYIPQR
ncbi:MAG: hypothetical protein JW827_00935 [Spirochaetes bacterium]|nr:hypothetical protein [Spirochaetota bacterium]